MIPTREDVIKHTIQELRGAMDNEPQLIDNVPMIPVPFVTAKEAAHALECYWRRLRLDAPCEVEAAHRKQETHDNRNFWIVAALNSVSIIVMLLYQILSCR